MLELTITHGMAVNSIKTDEKQTCHWMSFFDRIIKGNMLKFSAEGRG